MKFCNDLNGEPDVYELKSALFHECYNPDVLGHYYSHVTDENYVIQYNDTKLSKFTKSVFDTKDVQEKCICFMY